MQCRVWGIEGIGLSGGRRGAREGRPWLVGQNLNTQRARSQPPALPCAPHRSEPARRGCLQPGAHARAVPCAPRRARPAPARTCLRPNRRPVSRSTPVSPGNSGAANALLHVLIPLSGAKECAFGSGGGIRGLALVWPNVASCPVCLQCATRRTCPSPFLHYIDPPTPPTFLLLQAPPSLKLPFSLQPPFLAHSLGHETSDLSRSLPYSRSLVRSLPRSRDLAWYSSTKASSTGSPAGGGGGTGMGRPTAVQSG